jgi:F-type H+-transporting ATPase subunit b
MRRRLMALSLLATIVAPPVVALAQEGSVANEQQQGSASPEGGGYGAGADVHEDEAHGIINWFSWDYDRPGVPAKNPAHRGYPPPFFYALVNFAVFLAIMVKLAWKPLVRYIADRHEGIAKDLREAATLRKDAEQQLKEYQAKLAGIDREIETLLAQIRKEAETEKARIIAAAEADAQRLKLEAERQIAAEIDRARRELRRGVVEAAVAAADAALKKNIGADDQRKMAERYVGEVEQQAKLSSRRPS